jgi:hypothetical protein
LKKKKEDKDMLNARVCRRSKENIILLWDKKNIPIEDQNKTKVYLEGKPLKIRIASSIQEITDDDLTAPDNTEACLINHEENDLDPGKDYIFTVEVGKLQQDVRIYSYGVLPETEKDEKEKHLQLMAWNSKKRRWQKVSGVETDHGFAILVKVINK